MSRERGALSCSRPQLARVCSSLFERRSVHEGARGSGDDHSFDWVTGFNSFFFAADLVAALREAGRVAKTGAPVVIQFWGPPERCDLEAMTKVARSYAQPPPPDAPPPPKLWERGVLESLAIEAGLTPETAFGHQLRLRVPRRGDARPSADRSHGPRRTGRARARTRPASRDHRRAGPYRRPDGSYRLDNEFHYLVARA